MTQIAYQHGPGNDLIGAERAERIHALALEILRDVGLAVSVPSAVEMMAAEGFRVSGDRVFFEPAVVDEYLAERRRKEEPRRAKRRDPVQDDGKLYLTTGVYAHHVHDLESDSIVPYTLDRLVEMTKLVDVLTERGVQSPAPGYPMDMPGPLQAVAKYWAGARYSRHGEWPVDPVAEESIPYVMEMGEVMGHPLRHLPVYVFSPLRLAGESLDAVMRFRDRLDSIHVGAMPSVGVAAPVLPFAALAMAAAEVIGAFITLQVVTGLPVNFGIGLHAADLRSGTMIFGSPESYLLGQLNAEINAFYSPWWAPQRGNATAGIHVRANFPGAQSAAEKASLMTAGALIGVRWFDGAGILAVDEVFSAEQLLLDCEIKDQVQRLVGGWEMDGEGYDWVSEIREGTEGSFIALESTRDHYRLGYWHPQLFDRGFLQTLDSSARTELARKARDMAESCIARHTFELDETRRREMDRIWARAQRELA
ncbi:MAG: trimethylamine methyltransferase family protein [Anaerolineae bacterium]